MLTREELEERLGPYDEFVLSNDSIADLRLWALAIGMPPVEVYGSSNAALTNLYHMGADAAKFGANITQKATEIFIRCIETLQHTSFNPDTLKAIIADAIKEMVPRKLEVVTPASSIILDHPYHYSTPLIITIASLAHPIMQVGPAGCGKTTIAAHVAKALNLPFFITSTINETHELVGFVDGYGKYHRTPFRDAFEHGGIWVADEIDAWDASALLAANAALANGYAVFPDNSTPVNRHANFRMIATANTFGHGADRVYIGRNQLDAATLDRFAVINVDYDLRLEQSFAGGNSEWLEYVWKVRKRVFDLKIRHVVSTRAIINGTIALAAGVKRHDVEEIYLFKGMSKNDRDKLKLDEDDDVPF